MAAMKRIYLAERTFLKLNQSSGEKQPRKINRSYCMYYDLIFKSLNIFYHEEGYKKPILFFVIAFILSQTVPAQNSDIKKDKSYSGSGMIMVLL